MRKLARWAVFAMLALLCACAAGGPYDSAGQPAADLAEKDVKAMPDSELLAYFYDLDEEIRRKESGYGGTSIGFGVGTGGHSGGVGVGVSQHVGGGRAAADLRERRTEVRMELLRRGINP